MRASTKTGAHLKEFTGDHDVCRKRDALLSCSWSFVLILSQEKELPSRVKLGSGGATINVSGSHGCISNILLGRF